MLPSQPKQVVMCVDASDSNHLLRVGHLYRIETVQHYVTGSKSVILRDVPPVKFNANRFIVLKKADADFTRTFA